VRAAAGLAAAFRDPRHDCQVVAAACSRPAMSIFFILSIACMTLSNGAVGAVH
jgi:hypothetical protein